MNRIGACGLFILILGLSLIGCSGPELSPTEIQKGMDLAIVYPQGSTEIAGGQSIRITVLLNELDGQPIEAAAVEAELWSPDGKLIASLPCPDMKSGRYLSDYVTLPTRNSLGLWRVTARAVLDDGRKAEIERQFIGQISYSERLEQNFGFWIELTNLLPYNFSNAEDPLLKTYSYDDGGYVILANNLTTTQINNSFVILDVHWRQTDYPLDELAAANYVLDLAGPHRVTLDLSPADLVAEKNSFLGSPAWHVTGWWKRDNAFGDPRPDSPLDWLIFQCPGSEKLWTVLITTNDIKYLDDLKLIRESFTCSAD